MKYYLKILFVFLSLFFFMNNVFTQKNYNENKKAKGILGVDTSYIQNSICGLCNGKITVVLSGIKPYNVEYNYGQSYYTFNSDTIAIGKLCPGESHLFLIVDSNGDSVPIWATIGMDTSKILNLIKGDIKDETCKGRNDGEITINLDTIDYHLNENAFVWSNGIVGRKISGISGGKYSINISTLGCELYALIEIYTYKPKIDSFTIKRESYTGSKDAEISVFGDTNISFYNWIDKGKFTSKISNLYSGEYCVCPIDNSLCYGDTNCFYLTPRDTCYNFSGIIYSGESRVESGEVYLYKVINTNYIKIATANIINGEYAFKSVCNGNYTIGAIDEEGIFDITYYGNITNINNSHVIPLAGTVGSVDINLQKVGIESISKDDIFNIFPNPAKENLYLAIKNKDEKDFIVNIYNLLGEVYYTNNITNNDADIIKINISDLKSGMFIFEVYSNKYKQIKFFIKE